MIANQTDARIELLRLAYAAKRSGKIDRYEYFQKLAKSDYPIAALASVPLLDDQ